MELLDILISEINMPITMKCLRILIVEDSPERQTIMKNLFSHHAWILANTAARANKLLSAFEFDLVSLDYDLAGRDKGDQVARFLSKTKNISSTVLIHSMNASGAQKILEILPDALYVPLSRITRDNTTFKKIKEELKKGTDINWNYVFKRDAGE